MPENTTPDQPEKQPQQPQDETAPIGAASGNRWEQAAHEQPPAGTDATTQYVAPTGPVPPAPEAPYAAPAKPGRSALVSGIAAATLVLVGAGAFVAGRASAGEEQRGFQVDQQWQQGVPPGAPGQGTIPGQGTVPGQGTIPGAPGAPDVDGDDDDHDFHFGFGDDDDDDDHDEDED